jgi:hypothetical protein
VCVCVLCANKMSRTCSGSKILLLLRQKLDALKQTKIDSEIAINLHAQKTRMTHARYIAKQREHSLHLQTIVMNKENIVPTDLLVIMSHYRHCENVRRETHAACVLNEQARSQELDNALASVKRNITILTQRLEECLYI